MARTNPILPKIFLIALAGVVLAGASAVSQAPAAASSGTDTSAVLKQYCVSCHNDQLQTAGLSLNRLDPARVQENPAAWEKVVRKLRTGTMPPPGSARPAGAAYDLTASWLEAELDRTAQPNPG